LARRGASGAILSDRAIAGKTHDWHTYGLVEFLDRTGSPTAAPARARTARRAPFRALGGCSSTTCRCSSSCQSGSDGIRRSGCWSCSKPSSPRVGRG